MMSGFDIPDIPFDPVGYCAPYNGEVCRRVLNSTGLVWYNSSVESGHGLLNEQVTKSLWKELILPLREPCRSAAEVMLCRYAFPDCAYDEGIYPVGLPLCYEDCVALKDSFCYHEWILLEENKRRGKYLNSRGHFRLPVCSELPSLSDRHPLQSLLPDVTASSSTSTTTTVEPDTSMIKVKKCSRSGLTVMKEELVTQDCIRHRGQYYQGDANVTASGIPCQHWDEQKPHRHSRPPNVFPELRNASNKCRNAGAEEIKPWCYTTDPTVRWELCDISYCDNETVPIPHEDYTSDLGGVRAKPPDKSNSITDLLLDIPSFALIGGVAAGVFLVILLLGSVWFLCARRKRTRNGYMAAGTAADNSLPIEVELEKLPVNTSYHYTGAKLHPKLESLEYPRNDIIYIRDLGQGMFGRVFQARAPGLIEGEEFTIVAVKALKEEASPDLQANFEKEACLLAEFDHPNIVRLLGVCATGRPMCLLLEYMGRGDLTRFLRASAPTNYVVRSSDGSSFSDMCLTHPDKVFIAKQIAAGMVYLSDRGFVHRDLATRNCLVSEMLEVKISDFGLSERLDFESHKYKGKDQDAIPVRWMPLESITTNEFTLKSDVWAFGVCLWEIFTYALQPYYGMTHEEVISFLRSGSRLPPPESCPPSVYELMRRCWTPNPDDRPGFKVVFGTLELIQGELERLMAASVAAASNNSCNANYGGGHHPHYGAAVNQHYVARGGV